MYIGKGNVAMRIGNTEGIIAGLIFQQREHCISLNS